MSVTTSRPPIRVWDLVLTIVLVLGLFVLAAFGVFSGLLLAFASDGCGTTPETQCDSGRLTAGVLFAVIAPSVVAVVATIAAIVASVRRRLAFWIPLVGAALMCGAWALGAWITFSAVPGATS